MSQSKKTPVKTAEDPAHRKAARELLAMTLDAQENGPSLAEFNRIIRRFYGLFARRSTSW